MLIRSSTKNTFPEKLPSLRIYIYTGGTYTQPPRNLYPGCTVVKRDTVVATRGDVISTGEAFTFFLCYSLPSLLHLEYFVPPASGAHLSLITPTWWQMTCNGRDVVLWCSSGSGIVRPISTRQLGLTRYSRVGIIRDIDSIEGGESGHAGASWSREGLIRSPSTITSHHFCDCFLLWEFLLVTLYTYDKIM